MVAADVRREEEEMCEYSWGLGSWLVWCHFYHVLLVQASDKAKAGTRVGEVDHFLIAGAAISHCKGYIYEE